MLKLPLKRVLNQYKNPFFNFSLIGMNLKQNLLVFVCLFSSLLGLIFIYFAVINIRPTKLKINEINSELIGKSVTTEGKIIYKNSHPSGHLFLTISDGESKIQVPLFAGLMSKLDYTELSQDDFEKGKTIIVTGLVGEYKGSLQITPRKVEDVKILD